MGIFRAMYNWLAQRNIGEKLGMRWDPEKDIGHQRKMNILGDDMKASQWMQVYLPDARQWIETGDYERAHRIANRALLELSNSNHPIIKRARDEAQRIHAITSAHVKQPDSDRTSNDYFNAAADLARKLHTPVTYPGEYNSTLAEIVRLCQLAIRKDNKNGDAYVVLANAYFVLANTGGSEDLYNYCIGKAGAVIHHWKTEKMHTRNRDAGEQIYQQVSTFLAEKYPYPPRVLASARKMEYPIAVNPDDFPTLEELVNK